MAPLSKEEDMKKLSEMMQEMSKDSAKAQAARFDTQNL